MAWRGKLPTPAVINVTIMELLERDRTGGLMVDDLVALAGQDTNVIAPRVFYLVKAGLLEKSGLRGMTRKGTTANRWRLTAEARS